ncbi:hypothetical protein SJ05684_c07290 [Sinorhizobium sojae CCBAU 05684]|uniref:Uncharacterized protein n=1 Tax=Sinorhizobium sojae CCBAU 05684 TaxID=716928 RepID=A0A249P8X2_9HYPH|nr:hypothetical protein SJ05684_c07290 [Sinorhizobium sojae CCBAU 05684]
MIIKNDERCGVIHAAQPANRKLRKRLLFKRDELLWHMAPTCANRS